MFRPIPVSIRFALAICWVLSGCRMADWQQANYGPGGFGPGPGQYPGAVPGTIDLGNPSGDSGSFEESNGPTLSEPRTFESQRPVTPPAGSNPSGGISDPDIPGPVDGDLSVPQTNRTTSGKPAVHLFVPPLRGPIRMGESTFEPFPEGRWQPPANPPVASSSDLPERAAAPRTSQPLPLTNKAQPDQALEFPLRRPEEVLNAAPDKITPDNNFDLPPPLETNRQPTDAGKAEIGKQEPGNQEAGPVLPAIEVPKVTAAVPEFQVDVPPSILVGEATTITVRMAAHEGETFKNLKLHVTPGSGLVCSSTADDSALILDCPELHAGQTQKLTFDLQAVSSGTHEFTVSLKSGENELAWKKLNLAAQPRQLMTQLIGPGDKPVNGRAEFTLKIENVSQQALGPIEAILEFDSTLVPMEASAGAEQKPGQLVWSFPVLHPGELMLLQAEYACPVESGSTRVSAYVSVKEGPVQERQSSLTVQRTTGTLRLEVLDRNDLSAVNREMTGVVRLTNLSLQPARDVKVRFDSPELLEFSKVTASLGGKPVEIQQSQTGGKHVMTLPSDLPPDETLELEITFKTLKEGDGTLQVDASAAGIAEPVRASEPFTVTP